MKSIKHDGCDVFIHHNDKLNFTAIVAVHDLVNERALGGCRFLKYNNTQDAINDAVRLAKAMSKKTAIAGLPFGGGKAVIIKHNNAYDPRATFEEFGAFIDNLPYEFITGCDVGVTHADMQIASCITNRITALQDKNDSKHDNLSYLTAFGVTQAINAVTRQLYPEKQLSDLHVTIQGLGKVGMQLMQLLKTMNMHLTVTDIDVSKCHYITEHYGLKECNPNEIYDVPSDILSPCALGNVVNATTINRITSKIICGASNNQLANPEFAEVLFSKNITYLPDFLVNSGGAMYAAFSYLKINLQETKKYIRERICLITNDILAESTKLKVSPFTCAVRRVS